MTVKMTCLYEKKLGAPQLSAGFTLIELLVAIAVLAALIAIFVPVLLSVRERGRQTTCLNNMRQLGLGMMQYVTDADETFPQGWENHAGQGWAGKSYPYIKQQKVLTCPDDPTEVRNDGLFAVCSFGFNSNLSGYHLTIPQVGMPIFKSSAPLSVLTSPSATALFFEIENNSLPLPITVAEDGSASGNGFDEGGGMAGIGFPGGPGGQGSPIYATGFMGGRSTGSDGFTQSAVPRHGSGANYLACDGHAAWLRPETISGGSNAVAADCLQGTNKSQPTDCQGQTTLHAAGTQSGKQILTFSSL